MQQQQRQQEQNKSQKKQINRNNNKIIENIHNNINCKEIKKDQDVNKC